MDVNELRYGNPTIEQLDYLTKKTFVDVLFEELSSFTFPKNSSESTKEELNQIADSISALSGQEEYINRYKVYDRNLIPYFKKGLTKDTETFEQISVLIDDIIEDTTPILLKLKYHFQRPRPYQLAEFFKLKLFPYKSYSCDSPSFPSAQAYHGKILTEVIGNTYPEIYAYMQSLFEDICYSRVHMGLHYQSDIDVGIFCAEKVIQMKEFATKYKL